MSQCFLITPLSGEAAGNEPMPLYGMVQTAIAQAARELDLQLLKADDIFAPGVIMEQIRAAIETSEHIIVVCTGRNANVFYELGLADAIGHQPILLASAVSDLPFDVSHRRSILYGQVTDISTVTRDLVSALRTTPPRRSESPEIDRHVGSIQPEVEGHTGPSPATHHAKADRSEQLFDALRSGNVIDWDREAKRRILAAGSTFSTIYAERSSESPGDASLASLAATRYNHALAVAEWLSPAAEYRSDWLSRRLPDIVRWYGTRPNDSGFTFWINLHQTWAGLVLRSLLAVSLSSNVLDNVVDLLGVEAPATGADRSEYPFVLRPAFVWPEGYGGNGEVAHQDFVKFAALHAPTLGLSREPLDLACGVSFLLSMCSAGWGSQHNEYVFPRTYAAFATAYCSRIGWVARLLERSDAIAAKLGYRDLVAAQASYRELYPLVARRNDEYNRSCDTWDEALRS